jgi:hypothetical protein
VALFLNQDSSESKAASGKSGGAKSMSKEDKIAQKDSFRRFQFSYLTVYLITMLADWLQGTNMYTLYSGYDMPVGMLFITGFTRYVTGSSILSCLGYRVNNRQPTTSLTLCFLCV